MLDRRTRASLAIAAMACLSACSGPTSSGSGSTVVNQTPDGPPRDGTTAFGAPAPIDPMNPTDVIIPGSGSDPTTSSASEVPSGQPAPGSQSSTAIGAATSTTTTSRPPVGSPTTTVVRNIIGGPPPGQPFQNPQPPPSPPLVGPQTTTTTLFIGPTVPPAPTTTINSGPFKCTILLSWTTVQNSRAVQVDVVAANRGIGWVVLNWPNDSFRFGLDLSGGDGSRAVITSQNSLPAARVFVNDREQSSDLGCQA